MDQMQTVPGPSQAAFNTLNNQITELDKDSFDLAGDTVYTGDVYSATHGVYRCSSSATNLPVATNGFLTVIIRANDSKYIQFVTDGGRTFTNTHNGVSWTGWQELTTIKTKSFTAHTNATWGTFAMPSPVTASNFLFAYLTGTYSFYGITARGDNQMFAWYFNNSGVATVLRDEDVNGVIVYR